MPAALTPKNENERLAALRRYGILDTPPEPEFDDFTMLAAQICGTPVSLIALVDSSRQWFKSRRGLDLGETPRDFAFCAHALDSGNFLEVSNLLKDRRFSDNPLVTGEPGARFYAGAPLVTPDGFVLGALCVVDFKPRKLNPKQRQALAALGRGVMRQLGLLLVLKRERELKEEVSRKNAYQRALLNSAACAIISTDAKGIVTTFNSGAEQLLGYKAEEVVGKPVPRQWHDPDEVNARAKVLSRELGREIPAGFEVFVAKARQGEGETREWTFFRRDGTRAVVLLSVSAKRNEHGGLNGFMGVALDLTKRREAEDQRERMFNLSPDLMGIAGVDGYFRRVNPAFTATLGYSAEEIVSRPFMDFVHPQDREATEAEMNRLRQGEQTYHFHNRYRCKDGSVKWLSWRVQPYLSEGLLYATARDVTDIREAAAELSASEERLRVLNENLEQLVSERSGKLKESEERYRSVMESANDGIVSTDWQGCIISWNKAAERLFGYRSDEILGQYLEVLMPERYRAAHNAGFKNHLSTGESSVLGRTVELRGLHRSGREFPLELSLSAWKTDAGQFFTGILRDITDRHDAEMKLQGQQEMLKSLLENLAEGVVACDADGKLTFFNRTARDWHGVDTLDFQSEKQPQTFGLFRADGITPMDRQDIPHLRALRGERVRDEEMVIKAEGSEPRHVLASGDVLRDANGRKTGAVLVMRDITERKQVEAQRLRAQRLESLGTLAGGIAHDLNNALAPVLLGVELLRINYPAETEVIESMEASMKHGAGMVRQLLTFAKGVEGNRLSIRPEQLVQELSTIIKSTFPKNIRLRTSCAEKLWSISGDATQLQQVLLNLCVNARDAMPNGGILMLEAENERLDASYAATIPGAAAGSYVLFRVRDTGTGIPPEVLERIFEPFFSTKGPDLGTGLGLFTTAGIVKGHKGFVRVDSTPGKGSVFAIYLPAEETKGEAGSPSAAAGPPFRGNGETILVVDDEASVRQVARAVLVSLNFQAITASDGTEALIQLAEKRTNLKGVITDVHMPGMDGLNFVKVLKRMSPDAGILVSSGRMDEKETAEFKALGVKVILSKPFTQEELQEGLRRAFQGG